MIVLVAVLFPDYAAATHYPSSRIMRYARNTPRAVESNLDKLVTHLVRPLDDDYDKAKMIAFWIASHIRYDDFYYNGGKTTRLINRYSKQTPRELLESRAGICGDFTMMFEKMCQIAGISARSVNGFVYQKGFTYGTKRQKDDARHAWNYFNYEGRRVYVDVTFMAGGRVGADRRVNELSHTRALRKVKNQQRDYLSGVNEYYFDFDYKDEYRTFGNKRKED